MTSETCSQMHRQQSKGDAEWKAVQSMLQLAEMNLQQPLLITTLWKYAAG